MPQHSLDHDFQAYMSQLRSFYPRGPVGTTHTVTNGRLWLFLVLRFCLPWLCQACVAFSV